MSSVPKASAIPFIPATHSLAELRAGAAGCRGCDLYAHATQVVFGEGPTDAKVVLVGEQPGDEEDRKGHPFVGPAGRLLDKAMTDAGLDRDKIYVTNAVKHFKWLERGKRRIHAKPNGIEISACRPWLEAEITALKPDLIVCLGAIAAQSLIVESSALPRIAASSWSTVGPTRLSPPFIRRRFCGRPTVRKKSTVCSCAI